MKNEDLQNFKVRIGSKLDCNILSKQAERESKINKSIKLKTSRNDPNLNS